MNDETVLMSLFVWWWMMIYGNVQAQEMLRKIINVDGYDKSVFVILSWPDNVGKSSFVKILAREMLGDYFNNDFMYVRDLTEILWKKHNIKIWSNTASSDKIQISENEYYNDIWVRDMSYWLQQSWVSGKKFLLIENIDRMTISAANAFLKSAEEPLPGRIIIATSNNKSQLMDTIISRAVVVWFNSLSEEDMSRYIDSVNLKSDVSNVMKKLLIYMAMGRPWLLMRMIQDMDNDVLKMFERANNIMMSWNIQEKYASLIELNKIWYFQVFLDAWIAKSVNEWIDLSDKWLILQKNMRTNVSKERLILDRVLL